MVTRTSGSEGGPEKPTSRVWRRALRSDPTDVLRDLRDRGRALFAGGQGIDFPQQRVDDLLDVGDAPGALCSPHGQQQLAAGVGHGRTGGRPRTLEGPAHIGAGLITADRAAGQLQKQ